MPNAWRGAAFDHCETANITARQNTASCSVLEQAAPVKVSAREYRAEEVGAFNIKTPSCLMATSAAVCGSRLLPHVEPRHDLFRDHVRGFAMVKSGSPPGVRHATSCSLGAND